MDDPERVWLEQTPHRRVARWRQVEVPLWAVRWVTVGELRDGTGRWYVDLVDLIDQPARVYADDTAAYEAARRVMDWLIAQHGGGWGTEDPNPTRTAMEAQPSPER